MSKWDSKLQTINELKGRKSASEIAKIIGTSTSNLHKICHRNYISLPRREYTYKGGRRKKRTSLSDINKAIDLLVNAGYRVYEPTLFLK